MLKRKSIKYEAIPHLKVVARVPEAGDVSLGQAQQLGDIVYQAQAATPCHPLLWHTRRRRRGAVVC